MTSKELVEKWLTESGGDSEKALALADAEFAGNRQLRKAFESAAYHALAYDWLHNYRTAVRNGRAQPIDTNPLANMQVKGTSGEQFSMPAHDFGAGYYSMYGGLIKYRDATFEELLLDTVKYRDNLSGNWRNIVFNKLLASAMKERGAKLTTVLREKITDEEFKTFFKDAEKLGASYAETALQWAKDMLQPPPPTPVMRRTRKTVVPAEATV